MMTILESEEEEKKKKKGRKDGGAFMTEKTTTEATAQALNRIQCFRLLRSRCRKNKQTDKTKIHKQVTDCWGIIFRSGRPSTEWIGGWGAGWGGGGGGGGRKRIHREKKIRLPSKRAYWVHQFPSGAESDNNVLLGTFCKVSWDDGIHRTQILAAWLITHFRLPPAPNYPSGPRHLPASYRQSCRFSPSKSVVLILVQFQLITELP